MEAEADLAEMEEFIEQVKLLLATMGVDAFDEANARPSTAAKFTVEKTGPFIYMAGEGYQATCTVTEGEFVVQKDSCNRTTEAPSLSESSKAKRREMLAAGVLMQTDKGLIFVQDFSFGSASGAAQVVCGASVNGKITWKLKDGTTYADWQDKQLYEAATGGGGG